MLWHTISNSKAGAHDIAELTIATTASLKSLPAESNEREEFLYAVVVYCSGKIQLEAVRLMICSQITVIKTV